jgi:hypothetical protein
LWGNIKQEWGEKKPHRSLGYFNSTGNHRTHLDITARNGDDSASDRIECQHYQAMIASEQQQSILLARAKVDELHCYDGGVQMKLQKWNKPLNKGKLIKSKFCKEDKTKRNWRIFVTKQHKETKIKNDHQKRCRDLKIYLNLSAKHNADQDVEVRSSRFGK